MKRTNRFVKGLLLSTAALATGFIAIAVPFRIFDTLTNAQARWFFAAELALYFTVSMVFIAARERMKIKRRKEEERRFQRRIKFEKAREEYYDLVA